MSKPVTNKCCNKKCSQCGECCGPFLPLTYHEIKKIKKAIKDYNITYNVNEYITDTGIHIQCPFLDMKTRKCKLHAISTTLKPEVCRRFQCNLDAQTIHNNKIYKINLLDNSTSLVNFTLTWSPNSSYLEANAHYEELHLMLPRTVITAPLHIAGRYEVSTAIQVLDESQSSAMQETFSYSGTFTKLTNGITLQDGMAWFSEWGRQVNEEYSAVCSTEYKIYDSNNNLIHTGAFRWETVGVTSTRD